MPAGRQLAIAAATCLVWLVAPCLAALVASSTAAGTAAGAVPLNARCVRLPEQKSTEVQCDVRALEPVEIDASRIIASLADGKVLKSDFTPYDNRRNVLATLFLIQRTSHPRDGAREVERLIRLEGRRVSGVYSFADGLEEHARLGASEPELKKALANIALAKPSKTALYGVLYDAIRKLTEQSADRKAIVLVADGRTERDGAEESRVVEFARRENVAIFAVALTGGTATSDNLTTLRKLAEATHGAFQDAGSKNELSSALVTQFYGTVENGGTVKFADAEVPDRAELSFTAKTRDGRTGSVGNVPAGPSIAPRPRPTEIIDVIMANWVPSAAIAVITAGLLLVVYSLAARRPKPAAQPSAPPTEIIAELEPTDRYAGGTLRRDTVVLPPGNGAAKSHEVYAWLQFLDQDSTRWPIGSASVRIGRHKDNDVRLMNNSVHRQHAVLHRTQEGRFIISDLRTDNGVVVNGIRVVETELTDGDMLEFGEVRARFIANRAVTAA